MPLVRAGAPALVLLVVGAVPAAPAAAGAGPWGWPLTGPPSVSRPFAPPAGRYGAGHRGADLPATPGAAVRAAGAGRVTYAGLLAGRGVVVVAHGTLRTTYEPVAAAVRVGQAVARGEVVGHLAAGHLGCPAAACLHWGLRRGEDYLDPVRLVERRPVRLLPHPGPARDAAARRPPPPAEASGSAVARPEALAPAPAPEGDVPRWSLRGAEAPLGAAAVVALVLGIGLLARPRPHPPEPAPGGAAGRSVSPDVPQEAVGPDAQVLDLDDARLRRRPAS